MSYYQAVENIRKQKRYIHYLFYTLDDSLKDEFNIDLDATKYIMRSLKTGLDKNDIISSFLTFNNASNKACPFYTIENILKGYNLPSYILDSFRRILVIKNKGDDNIPLNIAFAMACFDYYEIIKDLKACQNDITEIRDLLSTLSLEAEAVALNGAFAKLFLIICQCGEKSCGNYQLVNKGIEQMVVDYYKKIMFGNRPLDFSNYFLKTSLTLTKLNRHLGEAFHLTHLSDSQIIENVINPFIAILNEDPSFIDYSDFDI